jgi:hypothetical protein
MHWIIQCYYGQQTLDCKVSPGSDIAFSEGGPKCWFAVIPRYLLKKIRDSFYNCPMSDNCRRN